MRIGIIGGGPAGVFTAKKIKALLPETDIVIYETTSYGLYAKIRLPEFLAGTLEPEKLIMESVEKFRSEGLDYRITTVKSVDPVTKTILSDDGKTETFTHIIFATGAFAFLPPIPGLAENDQTVTLRTMDDVTAIQQKIQPGKQAVVIGGGVLGLEAAFALQKQGMKVAVLECQDRLMQNLNFSAEKSAALKDLLEQNGLQIHTGCAIKQVSSNGSTQVELADGTIYECSLLLVSAGIRSNLSLAKAAGLDCKRGICVNARLETNVSGIYAIGDCAEQNGVIAGLWIAAKNQGEALAEIIAEKRDEYIYPPVKPILKIAGLNLTSVTKMV
ncbi:MAG: NAD(P)/FAD-dependent oxidoreductase [Lentisphaeria bacterium]|nr:NAD(P)/FAD-dependent oxidoreductase [Lentisphaeria bacterium]